MADRRRTLNFGSLVAAIRQVHQRCSVRASKAVNVNLTLRNWAVGCHIREYEQSGADRAEYGKDLFGCSSRRPREEGHVAYHPQEPRRCREFYLAYPQIEGMLSPEFAILLLGETRDASPPTSRTEAPTEKRGTLSPEFQVPAERHVTSLSFSTFVQPFRRAEHHRRLTRARLLRGGVHARQLVGTRAETPDRQSLLRAFRPLEGREEACGAGQDRRRGLRAAPEENPDRRYPRLRGLGLLPPDSQVPCTRRTQGRRLQPRAHGAAQHLRELVQAQRDDRGCRHLLCTRKDHALAKYAPAGLDNQLFVSKYQIELPSREEMQRFLKAQIEEAQDE